MIKIAIVAVLASVIGCSTGQKAPNARSARALGDEPVPALTLAVNGACVTKLDCPNPHIYMCLSNRCVFQ